MIQRVYIHDDEVKVVDNVPIEKAKEIFEREAANPTNSEVQDIQEKVRQNADYEPSNQELEIIDEWLKAPEIYLNEGQLQKMYQYPNGTNWEFLLHALGFRKIPTPKERISQGYEAFINSTTDFNDDQLKVLAKMKDIFATNLSSKQEIDIKKIFANPIYEKNIGKKEKINHLFAGKFDTVVSELKRNLKLPNA